MSGLTLAAATATVMAVLLIRPSPRWVLRVRLRAPLSIGHRVSFRTPVGLGIAALVVAGSLATSRPSLVILAATAAGAAAFAARQVALSRRSKTAVQTRAETSLGLDLLAAELRAGIQPRHALAALADDVPALRSAATAAVHGGDVAAALRAAGAAPGAEALVDMAGAWQVAERSGAPLAGVLDRVASSVRQDADVDRDIQAEAAPARATGRLMAGLPLLGLSLGAGMGADPVQVLTGTVVGAACLAAGVALACIGVSWVDRIVASASAA